MSGSDDMSLCNLLLGTFFGPYTVKYFLHQYLRYCLLSFSRIIFHYLTCRLTILTGRVEKYLDVFPSTVYKFWII